MQKEEVDVQAINKHFEQLNKMADEGKVDKDSLYELIVRIRDTFSKDRINYNSYDIPVVEVAIDGKSENALEWYGTKIVNLNKKAFLLLVSTLSLNIPYSSTMYAFIYDATFNNDIDKVHILIDYTTPCNYGDVLVAINLARRLGYTDIEDLINNGYNLEYDNEEKEYRLAGKSR